MLITILARDKTNKIGRILVRDAPNILADDNRLVVGVTRIASVL